MPAQKITTHGFLSEFMRQHQQREDRPFCWILGSGASFQSGIPTGGELTLRWIKELHEMEDFQNLPLEHWATAENLGIKDFDLSRVASYYPFIYQRRFRHNKDAGYAFLEKAMENAEPSYGYSVLAQIMAKTPHKIAITTNFDNLIADALSIYTRRLPLVCGHESLTGYISSNPRHPVIAKIHRDLLLSPMNNPEETEKLSPDWEAALTKIFASYTPVFLGYGGNDGSLMGFLKTMQPINGGIYWCNRIENEPDTAVHEVVEQHHGRLVPIVGFDEIMLQLWEKLQLPSPIPDLKTSHDKRVTAYQEQFQALNAKLKQPAKNKEAEAARKEVRAAAAAAVERLTKEKDWWAWQLKANAESDPAKAEAVYREGLEDFPKSAELTGNFALFICNRRKNYDEAERLYRKAMELNPENATVAGNFAIFMLRDRKKPDEAEQLYRKALKLDPNHGNNVGHFANFMWRHRGNPTEAERLYREALKLDPKNAPVVGNFANFMWKGRKNNDEAELLYRNALKLEPENVNIVSNFASFLWEIRQNHDEAERLYRKALELDPKHVNNGGNFANFLWEVRKNAGEAERLYRNAIELDPKHANNLGNFAEFTWKALVNHEEAETLYRKSLKLDPKNAMIYDSFANFMCQVRKNFEKAEEFFSRATELDPSNEKIAKNFAEFRKNHPSLTSK